MYKIFFGKRILNKFGNMELFFDKWRCNCNENTNIDDEIIGSNRNLQN
ncbi:Hypothetical protein PMT9312_1883 [Prochlorococcus marinus str. MIT 9312]|uniref:Uncharacterized protein n=1 Tax=Prochlorococcus marinus (strain MIT 9312) TaxID=74546 RepID=A7FAI5_PROM9|nr:Hypothetical protein PMT9312_1883 [Prochlorococcus marinus str. MIT 9312]KGG01924.1 hypothetical protein EU97_0179 [Prochlorococcus marinus str. MIT 9311]